MDRAYFEEYFGGFEDKRYQGFVEHKLVDVLILVMCGTLSGLDEPEDIVEYGNEKKDILREMFQIEKIPSLSTLTRVLNMVDGEAVAVCVIRIMCELLGTEGDVVPIDGKTICSTAKAGTARETLHIAACWYSHSKTARTRFIKKSPALASRLVRGIFYFYALPLEDATEHPVYKYESRGVRI